MSCEKRSDQVKKASSGCGITSVLSQGAYTTAKTTQVARNWVQNNPKEAKKLAIQLLGTGLMALYAHKQSRLQWQEQKQGAKTIVYGTTKANEQLDPKHLAAIAQAFELVSQNVGQPAVEKITIADDFAFSAKMQQVIETAYSKQGKVGQTIGMVYKTLKPFLIGQNYLKSKLGINAMAFATAEGEEIAFNQKQLSKNKLNGQHGKYIAVHELLHRVLRVKKGLRRGHLNKLKEEAVVDAISSHLVMPDYRGRRSGYDLIRSVANLQAKLIAKQTGETDLAVLIRQLGVDPAVVPQEKYDEL